jgi:hypothetical protein
MSQLQNFSPPNSNWCDKDGRLTQSAHMWLRDLMVRVGGHDAPTNEELGNSLTSGDKGDITIHAGVWTIDADVISAFGRTLTNDATAADARHTLGLDDPDNIPMPNLYVTNFDQFDVATGYVGDAAPGTLGSASLWRIRKLDFSLDGDVIVTFADGDALFDNVWDDRTSLDYS